MTNRILYQEREMLLNFFQLAEWHCSWDSILISIYRIDAHDHENKVHMLSTDESGFTDAIPMGHKL